MFKHEHVLNVVRSIRIDRQGGWEHTVEITTPLELNGLDENFSQSDLDAMLKAFIKWAEDNNQHWDCLKLVSG